MLDKYFRAMAGYGVAEESNAKTRQAAGGAKACSCQSEKKTLEELLKTAEDGGRLPYYADAEPHSWLRG